MPLEQLSLVPAAADPDGAADAGESRIVASVEGADEGGRTPRLPRWTRQEILILIQGKRLAENRGRRGRSSDGVQSESKWSAVSNYCKRHGVNRGSVQCRKRWSNLAGDYKKIKEWEAKTKDEMESFWVMRNDRRRERRLPGFFDREVYNILDRGPSSGAADPGLDLALGPSVMDVEPEKKAKAAGESEPEPVPVFDSSRGAATAEDGLFSDVEPEEGEGGSLEKAAATAEEMAAAPEPISEKQFPSVFQGTQAEGTSDEEQLPPNPNPELGSPSREARKRKRVASDDQEEETTTSLHHRLVDALERSGKLLASQLEAQNKNSQLDREQRKDQANGLLAILNKLADAVVRIAEKL